MKKYHLFLLLFTLEIFAQQGGMWIPSLLKGNNEKEMKSLGMKISAREIYNTNASSLKDAIVHFDGGCTAEVISPQGLILTNHHCGFDQIQSHSSLENDYISNGFWAKNLSQELPNIGTQVSFVVRIEDVTEQILKGTENLTIPKEKKQLIQSNTEKLINTFPKESWQNLKVKSFYKGNQYLIFVEETFKDVRLVGAPPASIGKFGSDTDNWVYPRHTGDFSLFRIYADKNNRPAEYSPDNVPYTPKRYLPISIKGLKENDFTFVFGYPGKTQEYLPSVAIEQLVQYINPVRIAIREQALKVQNNFMRQDKAIKIQYASKNASIANYWKKWKGENKGLIKTNVIAKKKLQEDLFLQKATKNNQQKTYENLFNNFNNLYKEFLPYNLGFTIFEEIVIRNTELLFRGFNLFHLYLTYSNKDEQAFENLKKRILSSIPYAFKDYSIDVDKAIFRELMAIYLKEMPEEFIPKNLKSVDLDTLTQQIYNQSALAQQKQLEDLLSGSAQEVIQNISNDIGFQLVYDLSIPYIENILPNYQRLKIQIEDLDKQYMKGILTFAKPSDRIYPDANSTLRVTYGKIKGYSPSDAVLYTPFTYLDGVMEKYIPNDYEFDIPKKLKELYQNQDYGIYADKNGRMPVCFIATNHTTGGNSGSPVLDARGNLIGLNFDRVWEGTMSDIYYDSDICRNIMVDVRYILFIIDKFAEAKNIIDELEIIK